MTSVEIWQAGIVGAITATFVSIVQLIVGCFNECYRRKVGRAKFGYDLIDALFAQPDVLRLFNAIDDDGQTLDHFIRRSIEEAMDPKLLNPGDDIKLARAGLDWLLFHFDRMEHAISAKLTSFDVVVMPVGYYVRWLAPLKDKLFLYNASLGYDRASRFLKRFDGSSLTSTGNNGMKPTFSRILIVVILLTWAQILLTVSGPMSPLHAIVRVVDVVVLTYCGWTLTAMLFRRCD